MQQQEGGSQFGAPSTETAGHRAGAFLQPPLLLAEAASPISSRPPPPEDAAADFDEMGPTVAGGTFPDEEAERGGAPGNRWPRQETLALLKIRSEMDAAFRDATFKGPLWEEISRKLAELGYERSAKKCKEKFENVHKYYKRKKDGRAGRQDGKTYRFYTELEALHSIGRGGATTPSAIAAPHLPAASSSPFSFTTGMEGPSGTRIQVSPISGGAPPPVTMPASAVPEHGARGVSSPAAAAAAAGLGFSSNSSSSSSSESDDEDTEEAGGVGKGRKRKHRGRARYRRQMMSFFEGLMKQVMERQEAIQQRFLDAIEKREQDRMKREEAWRLQEISRLSREQELLVQERAMAASRDSAVVSYLQKISGQSIPLPATPAAASCIAPHPPQPPHTLPPPTLPQQAQPPQQKRDAQQSSATQMAPINSEAQEGQGSGSFEPTSSSRWPKAEVHALIDLRSSLESRYQDSGPKGPLWEEISTGMQRLGYNRSAKRCKEKWENINKYFKKVKESNRKRPEDSKTCPYFHQLEALCRKKLLGSSGGGTSSSSVGVKPQQEPISQEQHQQWPPTKTPGDNGNDNVNSNGGNAEAGEGRDGAQVQTSKGGHRPTYFEEGKSLRHPKPEDTVKELMEQRQRQPMMDDPDKMDEPDSNNLHEDEGDDDDNEDDEDSKMQYEIQFQRQSVRGGGGGNASTTASAAATTAAGSFLAVVQ
ncbi:hypothetical protein GW17_00034480 [Ensete ventricosum]|uniref:Uncharacterized protein n=1 Tax=Ensete ventricosum TaxID=4639 RepID=A0A444DWC1_ENSVE|nr:hypothetical protein GW17_00034480 [Ensete ventricosum]RZR72630.1 hypothetical protein BHM03_00015228 [Ensete ventricosum]